MKNNEVLRLFSFSICFLLSCNNQTDNKAKSGDSTLPKKADTTALKTQVVDTAKFLKDNNMILGTLADIGQGQTVVLPGTSVYYPVLNMAIGSRLVIPEEYTNCTILIGKGSFEDNTEISADGRNGANGRKLPDPWDNGWWQAGTGQDGAKGVNGTNGESGRSGVPRIKIQIGLVSVVSLKIHANGGNGGFGGNAGKGQLGGNKSGPFGRNGGGSDGGDAGNGGDGGDGGNIQIEIWGANGPINLPSGSQLSTIAKGGLGSHGGIGGAPNEGGNHGEAGEPGKNGKNGRNGFDGTATITPVPKPILP